MDDQSEMITFPEVHEHLLEVHMKVLIRFLWRDVNMDCRSVGEVPMGPQNAWTFQERLSRHGVITFWWKLMYGVGM